MIDVCPICAGSERRRVYHARASLNIFTDVSGDGADRAFADLDIVSCASCRHLFNQAFDEDSAGGMYAEVPLTNAPVHPGMTERLTELRDWLPSDALNGTRIVEIGCGSGHLARLLSASAAEVTVYEPNRSLTADMLPEKNIRFVNDFFRPEYADGRSDLVICRQVLEHVADPSRLLRAVRSALSRGGRAYIEVPNSRYIIENASFLDLHMHHVQYFSATGLIRSAARAGLFALKIQSIKNGHDIGVLFGTEPTTTAPAPPAEPPPLSANTLTDKTAAARRKIAGLTGRIALYGANAYGQAFVGAMRDLPPFTCAFDDTAALVGRYALFDEQRLTPICAPEPEALAACDAIVITAYLHDEAILRRLREKKFAGPVYTVRPEPPPAGSDLKYVYAAD